MDSPGTYTIRVTRDGGKTGPTVGTYQLTVILDGSGLDSVALQGATGTVTAGTPITGEISNYRWADTWTYSGQEGEVIDIRAVRMAGTLVPMVEIRDQNGTSLYYAYPDDTNDSATITAFTLPSTAEYQIVVSRADQQNGYTTGSFELSVTPSAP